MPARRADIAAVLLACLAVALLLEPALAQTAPRPPFGLGGGRPAEAPGGLIAWMLARQAEFHRALLAALRQARSGEGAGLLVLTGFLYGAFHAAGPGHGKAVVSSYVFADGATLRRGVGVAFAAAFIQAGVAVALVWIVLALFAGAARHVDAAVRWIEIASFSLIALFGLALTWRKAAALRLALAGSGRDAADCAECGRFRLRYRSSAAASPAQPACGHVVIPDAAALSGPRRWSELAAIAFTAGARPCTGAILLLALARAADVFAVGVLAVLAMAFGTALATSAFALAAGGARSLASRAAERSDRLRPLLAALELAAALCVALIGALLLIGYLGGD